jgi:oligopeptide transport system substrate-binding protein
MISFSEQLRGQLAVAMMIVMSFAACSKGQPKPKIEESAQVAASQKLKINIGDEPSSLDPARARDLRSITLVKMLFEGLTRVNKGDQIEMAVADRVDISEDKRIYTFTLREVKWTSGEAVTAEDFVYAWKRALDPNTPADNAFQLYAIKNAKEIKSGKVGVEELGAKVLDEKTLQVELEQPTPYFLELASYPVYFPIKAQVDRENPQWANAPATFVSNGPFSLTEWKHEDCIIVKKSPTYWDNGAVHLEEISMYMLQSATELSMFENHEIDWAGSPLSVLPMDALGKLKAENLLQKKPVLGTYFLRMNTENAFLKSANIRKALSASISREELVEHALLGSQVAATGYVPEIFGLRTKSYFANNNSHEAIKAFEEGLEELTLTRAEMPQMEIIYPNSERNQRIVQLLQERWQKVLGIRLNLFAMEPKVYFEKVAEGDYEMAAGSWMADFNDPIAFLEIFKTKDAGANHTHWENEEYTSLIESSLTALDEEKRKEMLSRCEKILVESAAIIPLFHYNLLYVKDNKLQDTFISNLGVMDFRWAKFE